MGASLAAIAAPVLADSPTVITQWSFPNTASLTNSPPPSTGSGTASALGMTNNYTYTGAKGGSVTGAVNTDDILSSPSAAVAAFSEGTWRIRGQNPGNGWNLSAPQYSQGAEFDVSTVGFKNVMASFDWFSTNQGVRNLQEQYTIDGSNWININPLLAAVPNDFNQAATINGSTMKPNVIDLSSIAGAGNNPNFGIRLVSAFDPNYTGPGAPTYSGATLNADGSSAIYNNNSGNWRFDNITISGTAIPAPEPATGLFFAAVSLGLLLRRRSA
jgi:hypothetical protein